MLALLPFCSDAAEIAGVRLDETSSLGGQALILNGAGLRTLVVFKVYVASLYLPKKAAELTAVLSGSLRRIRLDMLRTVSSDQFLAALNEGIAQNNAPADVTSIKPRLEQFAEIVKAFGEVKEHDIVTLDFVDGATQVGLNGAVKGVIPGEPFNQALMRIWLGDNAVQPSLKKALLGG